jgi:gamma-carbonic anhydrase
MAEQEVAARLQRFLNRRPNLAPSVFVAQTADVIGAVSVGEYSSIWFQTVIRADINEIQIGRRTNIQDGSVLHSG